MSDNRENLTPERRERIRRRRRILLWVLGATVVAVARDYRLAAALAMDRRPARHRLPTRSSFTLYQRSTSSPLSSSYSSSFATC